MAPEQARGKVVDRRADIWAFGVVLYEMLTGRRPFQGEDVSETLAAVIKEEPDWTAIPAGTPPAVRLLLGRCLKKDPKERLRDIGDAHIMIETEDAALMVASESVPSRGSRGWKIAVAISTLMLMSTLPILISHWREEAPQPGPVMRFEVPLPSGVTSFDAPSLAAPFSVSPDGRHIVLGSGATAGGRRYWIRTLASLDTRELQTPSSVSSGLSWSIDSRSLGFVVDGRPKSMDIAAGTTETLSVDGSISPSSVLLGPDGKILMTHAGGISLVAKPGGPSVPLVKNEGAERAEVIQFLPGGRHFLFRVRVPNPERAGIYVESVEAGRPKREPGRLAPSSPTGRHC